VTPRCPACGAEAGAYARRVDDRYSIRTCPDCGLEHTDPMPSEDELRAFYADYRDVRADPRVVARNADDHLALLDRFGRTAGWRILDFGAGAGLFVEAAGEGCFGVEWGAVRSPRVVASLDELPPGEWDALTLWGVLEHLPDPRSTLAELVARLRPGGLVALTTVDAEGTIPYWYKPPEHVTYWTRAAMEALLHPLGLRIAAYEPYAMWQLGSVYTDRLLARTPPEYRPALRPELPELVRVPTNELRLVARKG